MLSPEELEFYDTKSIVVRQLKNDVAFKTKDNRLIIMVEHQSTLNENMPLRFLLYYAELIKLYLAQNELNIFSKKALPIPLPEFYVVYNGEEELQTSEMHLNANMDGVDEYIAVKAKIVNINYDKLPEEVLERNDTLKGYSYLINRIRYYSKCKKLLLEEAIDKAIEDTKTKGYLEEYLVRKEFITMIRKVLTIEEEIELIRREEREEGREEGKLEIARVSIKKGLPVDIIADITGFTRQMIEALAKSVDK